MGPSAVLLLVTAGHLGSNAGTYRASRPDVDSRSHLVSISIDGFMQVIDGIPTQVDAHNSVRLAGVFHGVPPAQCAGIQDFRPVPSLIQAAFSPICGRYWAGVLLNLLAGLLAAACAVDLARAWGRPPLVGVVFATLVVGGRATAFYVGCPDAHALSLAWMPIGVWVCERARAMDPQARPLGAIASALVIGLAILTHFANLALLMWLWLTGWRRDPWARLLGVSCFVGCVVLGWRLVGASVGLPFDTFSDRSIGTGLKSMWLEVSGRVYDALHPPPGGMGSTANTIVQSVRRLPPWGIIEPLRTSVVPAFGWGMLLLGGLGWLSAASSRADRIRAATLLLPSCILSLPILYHWTAPRLLCLGWMGLAWPASLLLVSMERGARARLQRWGVDGAVARGLARALLIALLGSLLLLENRDVFGDMTVPCSLIWG